jgi:hypothetical protein
MAATTTLAADDGNSRSTVSRRTRIEGEARSFLEAMMANTHRPHVPGDLANARDLERDRAPKPADPSFAGETPNPDHRSIGEAFGFATPRGYPYPDVATAARRGQFFGRGPKGYRRSDERIREEISDRLMVHPDVDASEIEVHVANGIVTLTGIVDNRHEKRLAEYVAEDALGVDDVDNRLKVHHGFWATIRGERATERELPVRPERDATASKEGGRADAARNAARRDADAR